MEFREIDPCTADNCWPRLVWWNGLGGDRALWMYEDCNKEKELKDVQTGGSML
jgi:hypothetical protein